MIIKEASGANQKESDGKRCSQKGSVKKKKSNARYASQYDRRHCFSRDLADTQRQRRRRGAKGVFALARVHVGGPPKKKERQEKEYTRGRSREEGAKGGEEESIEKGGREFVI